MEHRDIVRTLKHWYASLDDRTMTATLAADDKIITVKFHWADCPVCEGPGTHVDPFGGADGLTTGEMAYDWDGDYRDSYRVNRYGIDCYQCSGRRVVPVPDDEDARATVGHILRKRFIDGGIHNASRQGIE